MREGNGLKSQLASMFRIRVGAGVGALAVNCALAPSLAMTLLVLAGCLDASYEKLVAGKTYEHAIRAGNGGGQVPLPDGRWTLASWDIYANKQALGGVLIQMDGAQVAKLINFYVPYHTAGRWFSLHLGGNAFCKRHDVLYLKRITSQRYYSYGEGSDDNCWGVDHQPMALYGDVPMHLLELRDYLEAHELRLPEIMLVVRYRRLDGGPNRFSLDYFFNPELGGFDPPRQLTWSASEWHRDRALRDPRKKAYIDSLIEWGRSWVEQVEKGFRGNL